MPGCTVRRGAASRPIPFLTKPLSRVCHGVQDVFLPVCLPGWHSSRKCEIHGFAFSACMKNSSPTACARARAHQVSRSSCSSITASGFSAVVVAARIRYLSTHVRCLGGDTRARAHQVSDMITRLVQTFDSLSDKYGVFHLETIGDGTPFPLVILSTFQAQKCCSRTVVVP